MPDQQRYQVRLDWGEAGARRIGLDAHAVVVVDELDGHGAASAAQVAAAVAQACAESTRADGRAPEVLCATSVSAGDAAGRILRLQNALGDRCIVAIVGAGSLDDDGFRTTVEDHLAAGAVVDALAELGIDFSSPEAAVACAAWRALQKASGHLLTASASAARLGGGVPDASTQRREHPTRASILREWSAPA